MAAFFDPTPAERAALEKLIGEIPDVQQTLVKNHERLTQPDRGAHHSDLPRGIWFERCGGHWDAGALRSECVHWAHRHAAVSRLFLPRDPPAQRVVLVDQTARDPSRCTSQLIRYRVIGICNIHG